MKQWESDFDRWQENQALKRYDEEPEEYSRDYDDGERYES